MGEPGPKGAQVEPLQSLFFIFIFFQPLLKLDGIYESSGYVS